MSETNNITVTKTVFDLASFGKVKLEKTIPEPPAPDSVEAALAAAGNDTATFLQIFHSGLTAAAAVEAEKDLTGFYVVSDDDDDDAEKTLYTGTCATEAQGMVIKGMLANLAKAQGLEKSMPKARKAEIKANVANFVKANPALIQMLLGTPAQ